jgi:hypothetical protein
MFALIALALAVQVAPNVPAAATPTTPQAKSTAPAKLDPAVPPVNKPRVELVFALDTTGSMGGLIDGAKRKIWFIVDEVMKAKIQPEVKVGLVAFRDQSDAYVTKVTPLSDDLDAVYKDLMAFRADGGGDTPEDVELALHHALTQIQWSEGKDVLKIIFLVGDAPPQRYPQAVRWEKSAQDAVRRYIYINTVQAGDDASTTTVWTKIAQSAEGRFSRIQQDGGVVAEVATPFDADLAKLANELDATEIDYGSRAVRDMSMSTRSLSSAGTSSYGEGSMGKRGAAKAKMMKSATKVKKDLVTLYEVQGEGALEAVKNDELPDEMQKQSAEERKKKLEEMSKKRESIRQQIAETSKKRDTFIAEAKKAKKAPKSEFDDEVVATIRGQAKKIGLEY